MMSISPPCRPTSRQADIASGRATAALSIMVLAAVAALIFLSALSVGVEDAMLRNTVGLFSGHITLTDLDPALDARTLQADGVAAVLRRTYLPGTVKGPNGSQALNLCVVDPEQEQAATALAAKIETGRYPAAGRGEILISRDMAETLGVVPGQHLQVAAPPGRQAHRGRVVGIYHTGLVALDRGMAFVPRGMLAAGNLPWSAAVFLRVGVPVETIMTHYREQLGPFVSMESWKTQMPDLRQLIDLEAVSMPVVIVLVFGVVAIGIACSFVIFIIRNLREYGILKTMGVGRGELALLIVSKVVWMNAVACVAGVALGAAAVWPAVLVARKNAAEILRVI